MDSEMKRPTCFCLHLRGHVHIMKFMSSVIQSYDISFTGICFFFIYCSLLSCQVINFTDIKETEKEKAQEN